MDEVTIVLESGRIVGSTILFDKTSRCQWVTDAVFTITTLALF